MKSAKDIQRWYSFKKGWYAVIFDGDESDDVHPDDPTFRLSAKAKKSLGWNVKRNDEALLWMFYEKKSRYIDWQNHDTLTLEKIDADVVAWSKKHKKNGWYVECVNRHERIQYSKTFLEYRGRQKEKKTAKKTELTAIFYSLYR